jgi:uncharacterized protein (DUF302 family)
MLAIRNTSAFGFGVTSRLPFLIAVERVKEVFGAEGFDVVSQIDMRETLCESLGASIPPYTVLGLCNPSITQKLLFEETEAGLLMPCNVLVRVEGNCVQISVMNPYLLIRLSENNKLRGLSDQLFNGLERGLERFVRESTEVPVAA